MALTASEKLKPQNNPDDELPWAQHPFGKEMIKYLYVTIAKIKLFDTFEVGKPLLSTALPPTFYHIPYMFTYVIRFHW